MRYKGTGFNWICLIFVSGKLFRTRLALRSNQYYDLDLRNV